MGETASRFRCSISESKPPKKEEHGYVRRADQGIAIGENVDKKHSRSISEHGRTTSVKAEFEHRP